MPSHTPAARDGIPDELRDSHVLVADDELAEVERLEALLRGWGLDDIVSTADSSAVVELCAQREPDLIVLDLHMLHPGGIELLELLLPWTTSATPVALLGLIEEPASELRHSAVAKGARDFVTKPLDPEELRVRATNLLEARRLRRQLLDYGELLEDRVRAHTRQLDVARRDVLERLGRAAEYRDDNSREHTRRIGRTAKLLAGELGLGSEVIEMIEVAAPLHDIGKLGIPDAILLKPGRLESDEFELMKRHVVLGAELLSGSDAPELQMARRIALTHHERWGGGGYVASLVGEAIPIEGRIAAIADVFDALTHARPYKQAWSVERSLETVLEGAGSAFDPAVVEAFAALDHEALLAPIQRAPSRHRELTSLTVDAADFPPDQRPASARITLSHAAEALSVSAATLRRWSDSGRIKAERTAGGHRRFAVEEIRRLRSERTSSAPSSVRAALPPTGPITSLADLLADHGEEIRIQAARSLYREGVEGWFASREANRVIANWMKTLSSACRSGFYEAALSTSAVLARGAALAGTSLLERHTYFERLENHALRRLAALETAPRAEMIASRRLFDSVRQQLLAEPGLDG